MVHASGLAPERLVPEEASREAWEKHLERYRFAARFAQGCRVLDVACGTGYGSYVLRAAGATSVVGADSSPEAITYARRHYTREGLHFILADGEALPLRSSFDLAVSHGTLSHLRHPREFVSELWRVTKPGARLILSTTNRAVVSPGKPARAPSADPHHVADYTLPEVRRLLAGSFRVEECLGQVFHPAEGLLSTFNVLPVLARHPALPFRLARQAPRYLRSVVRRTPGIRDPVLESPTVVPEQGWLFAYAEPRHLILVCERVGRSPLLPATRA